MEEFKDDPRVIFSRENPLKDRGLFFDLEVNMAKKFDDGRIRLWKSKKSAEAIGLGVNFNRTKNRKEMNQVYKAIDAILTLKYGKGIKGIAGRF